MRAGMRRCAEKKSVLWVGLLGVLLSACTDGPPREANPWEQYAGVFEVRQDLLLVVEIQDERLTLLPSFWRTAQILEHLEGDRFRSLLHPRFGFEFTRDPDGVITSLTVTGHDEIGGVAQKLDRNEARPVSALLAGQPDRAFELLEAEGWESPDRAVQLGRNLLFNYPSRPEQAARFLERVADAFPESADVHAALGGARVRTGDRSGGLAAFRRAVDLDPENSWAGFALPHLDPTTRIPPVEPGWSVPFTLDEFFATPSESEIERVRRMWETRSLDAEGFEELERDRLETPYGSFEVRIVSHRVHGSRHFGAILVPTDSEPGCCPVVVDVRGVGWNYPPRTISAGLRTLQIMREDAADVVTVVPGLRGEVLQFGQQTFQSEGDRTNGWDGAADDVIAMLTVAIENTPEIDSDRACVYGKSRGGTVALLAGIRDPRLKCVVDWAGPTDWFRNMAKGGWTMQELIGDGLLFQRPPGTGAGGSGQFIEHFLGETVRDGKGGLAEARLRMIASSPLYFAESLPASDIHHGREDRSVPVINANSLRSRLSSDGRHSMTVHDGAGHDLPYPWAFDASREFLRAHLRLNSAAQP